MLIQSYAPAQTAGTDTSAVDVAGTADSSGRSTSGGSTAVTPEYQPMTASERARKYLIGAFGPLAILRAAAAGGIAQWTETPKEWRVGPQAYGDRFGNAFAKHVMREALEYGASAALHEDNRYFRSGKSGFGNRLVYALTSTVLARHDDGDRYVSASRLLSYAAAASLSRLWQPPSTSRLANAGRVFGITLGVEAGFNVAREFFPMIFHSHAPVAEPQP